MNEELLKAIVKLFAIVAKERITDDERSNVRDFLAIHLSHDSVPVYMAIFDRHIETANIEAVELDHDDDETIEYVDDWSNIMKLCKLINEGLTKQQKLVLLLKLFELMLQDGLLSERQSNLIFYIGEVIKVSQQEINLITKFLAAQDAEDIDAESFLLVDEGSAPHEFASRHIIRPKITGSIFVLRIPQADTYFVKYLGISALTLNGLNLRSRKTYVFPTGSTIRGSKMKPVFYSEVVSKFLYGTEGTSLSFVARNVSIQFKSGYKALNNINIAEEGGKLIGLMGASGSGKSTLLSVLNGSTKPTTGSVTINGLDIYQKSDWLQGIVGFVPQDDFLIEELTVYENLFYAAQLTFGQHTKEESDDLVNKTLKSLGLNETRDLKVGSALDKTISGGQRKRLNIGLELLRKPTILFVDEPTSGLSSRDSVNIMDLLKELALNGKMVFVVIHQPSSDIFKMFDTMIILDIGGYPVYYGNPEQALVYFKKLVNMVNKDEGACIECGNVNSEQIFNILEAKVVNEYGRLTDRRKIPAKLWHQYFTENIEIPPINERSDKLRSIQQIPAKIKQIAIFSMRDMQAKFRNQQYMVITFLEAPILAFFLAYLVKYYETREFEQVYVFAKNVNIPVYFFMAIIVALFMGLTLSAEELIKDRKILKRESFLNLSRMSYLVSKMAILLVISAIQTLCFVLIANWILEINNMYFTTWLILFSISVFANILGLIISSAFNSAVTVYILIPILIIPQLILSGVIIDFDQFNYRVSSDKHIPLMGDIMVSRWGYEALAVDQFVNNEYNQIFYPIDREINMSFYQKNIYIPELKKQFANVHNNINDTSDAKVMASVDRSLVILRNEIEKVRNKFKKKDFYPEYVRLSRQYYDTITYNQGLKFLDEIKGYYDYKHNQWLNERDKASGIWSKRPNNIALKNAYVNERMKDYVEKAKINTPTHKVLDDGIVRLVYPIYTKPSSDKWINLNSSFYLPQKAIFGMVLSTYWVNVAVIWSMTIFLVIFLYLDVLKKVVDGIGNFRENQMYRRKSKKESEE